MNLRLSLLLLAPVLAAQRLVIPLDGTWRVADSVDASATPSTFAHAVVVPGLTNQATPPFADVDRFDSREYIRNQISKNLAAPSEITDAVGRSRQQRNYFWYERVFTAPARKQVATLRVNKAQFGTAVWLNGVALGEHLGCFDAGIFDAAKAVRWGAENRVLIRIGAHPGALPPSVPAGTDQEKIRWTPGIYDSVSFVASDNPSIEHVQVAPRLGASSVVVQTALRNRGNTAVTVRLAHTIRRWREQAVRARDSVEIVLKAGEARTVQRTVLLPNAALWTPETPNLYTVETSSGGDALTTRFGMREFRFDTATKRAYLNGKPYYLRGSNITLHRFFEDEKCKGLPWNEAWVRKMLVDIPKQMHWNTFRFCIGPVPDRWLDIADEAGLLIQNEFFIWTMRNAWHKEWSTDELIKEFSGWMRDGWNHPSVAIWDASNETVSDILRDKVIPAVRGLDLSDRPWDNGYTLPQGPNDMVEDHPYLFSRMQRDRPEFRLTELETGTGGKSTNSPHPSSHAAILNEYGWLWVNRDGTPTVLTDKVYGHLLGPNATAAQRFEMNGYLLGALTEYWRAHRNFAGVLHFVYLTSSYPGAYTADHWRDVEKLELEPNFRDYVGEAFKPVGVYANFFQPSLKRGGSRAIPVGVVNDLDRAIAGKLIATVEPGGETVQQALSVPALGQHTWVLDVPVPRQPGDYTLRVRAVTAEGETLCRRRFRVD